MSILLTAALLAGTLAQTPARFDGKFSHYANLAVYPIYEPLGPAKSEAYISLDEGLKTGQVVITERGDDSSPLIRPRPGQPAPNREPRHERAPQQQAAGSVNTLWVLNKSGRKLLLIAGEMVQGGKQDRIIEKDAIIPPGKEPVNLTVYCVEQGRWAYQGGGGASGGFTAAPAMPDITVRAGAQHDRDQQEVWNKVARKIEIAGADAPTRSYGANFESKEIGKRLESYVSAIRASFPEKRAVGAIVAVDGRLIWMDRFANNDLFMRYWPKLLKSYAMEAITSPGVKPAHPTPDEASRFAAARDGKMSYEVEEGVSKLIRIDADRHVIYELQDVGASPPARLHESKMAK